VKDIDVVNEDSGKELVKKIASLFPYKPKLQISKT